MKKILMLLALAGVTSVASAQQTTITGYEVIQVQDKYQVITNPFWDNWFFSIGGGAEALFGDNDHVGKFRDRISPTLNGLLRDWGCDCSTVAYRDAALPVRKQLIL